MKKFKTFIKIVFLGGFLLVNSQETYTKACVVTAKKDVSDLAISVIKQGGNAFDAMVVCEMGLAVSYPFAGSLGGGGFMVYRLSDGSKGSLNFREKAPIKAHEKMFLDQEGNVIPNLSLRSALASGIPGNVAGIFEVHHKFGKLPIKKLLELVADFAEEGFVVTKKQAEQLNYYQQDFINVNKKEILFTGHWKEGDIIKNKPLANTFRILANQGKEAFYSGIIAEKLVEFIQKNNGIFSLEDLKNYSTEWQKPIEFSYKNFNITSMAPPSSGGLALAQLLKTSENYPLNKYKHNSTKYIQILTEIERRVYADRAEFLGDPNFVKIPVKQLLDKKYLKNRMNNFSWKEATPSSAIKHGEINQTESTETTHYSIIDTQGNAIAVTTTINDAYGSKLFCDELGFFMNNQMDDFSIKPGTPNMFGLIGNKSNKIEPQKRMLSSMTPTIVEKNNKLFMILGSPGGSTIITSVFQNILNVCEFNMSMFEAVSAPRFHHQWLPDEVVLEPNGFNQKIINELTAKKYNIKQKNTAILGKVNAILIKNNKIEAGADPRGDEASSGF